MHDRWAEEAGHAANAPISRKLHKIDALWQRRAINLDSAPVEAAAVVVHIHRAGSLDMAAGVLALHLRDVVHDGGASMCELGRIAIHAVIGHDLRQHLHAPLDIAFVPSGNIGVDATLSLCHANAKIAQHWTARLPQVSLGVFGGVFVRKDECERR